MFEALSRDFRIRMPWELLHADDLFLIADSQENEKEFRRREGTESRGLRINLSKTKVMISSVDNMPESRSGVWPCALCKRSVGVIIPS